MRCTNCEPDYCACADFYAGRMAYWKGEIMTQTPTDAPTVTPEDREAYLSLNMLPPEDAAAVRAGRWDGVTGMQVLARHRTAHAGEVEPVAWKNYADGGDWWLTDEQEPADSCERSVPLYTHPAPPADLVELVEALRGIIDDEPCWYDHHGYCQAHYVTSPCEMATARTALAKYLAKHGGA